MSTHDIIVVGTSAGGVEALKSLFSALNAELQASVFVVQHFRPHEQSFLPSILQRRTSLHVEHALDGEEIEPGRVLHRSAGSPHAHRSSPHPSQLGPKRKSNATGHQSAFSFRSSCVRPTRNRRDSHGNVGRRHGGAVGDQRRGGIAVVQSPDDAQYRQMPESAIQNV